MVGSLRLRLILTAVLGILLTAVAGCTAWPPGYLSSAVLGELRFLSRMRPIEMALNDPRLTADQHDKLAFLIRARDYCRDVVGLEVGNNFQSFVNLHGQKLAWNLTASRKDAFEPYIWSIPIAGPMPYLGFFKKEQAIAERDRLVKAGYDTFIYEIDAFALPYLPDPVTSRVLDREYGEVAEVVAHELTHNTVMKMDDVTFSESLANFVGRTVAVEFLGVEFGQDSPLIQETTNDYEDEDRFKAFVAELVEQLTVLYQGDSSRDEKIAQRRTIFEGWRDRFTAEVLPWMHNPESFDSFTETLLNNAFLLVNSRYNSDQEVFSLVFEKTGRDWPQTLVIFKEASLADDPVGYLRAVLEEP